MTFEVSPGQPPKLDLDKPNFSFAFPLGAASRMQTLTVRNAGGGHLDYTVTAATNNGGDWLNVTAATNQALPDAPATIAVTASPRDLPAGTYTGRVTLSTANETRSVPVTIAIRSNDRAILLSQSGLSFTAVAGGGIVPPRSFEVLNIGRGVVPWSVSTRTLSGGPSWLSVTPGNGSTDAASQTVPSVAVRVNPADLAPGSYYGLVQVDAAGAANSPQVITVCMEVLPAGSDPGPLVEPAELVFTGVAGRSSPSSKEVFVYNISASPKTFRSTTTLAAPEGDDRLVNLPTDLTLAVDQPNRVIVQPFIGNLPAGVHQGNINLQFSDGRVRTVRVQLILTAPASSSARFAEACTPTKLVPAVTSLASSVPVTVGWPIPITAEVRDDCGVVHDAGSVAVIFSNGDPSLSLQSIKDGRWTGTWESRRSSATTSLRVEAVNALREIRGEVTLSVDSRTRQEPPFVEASGVMSAVGLQPYVPLAPGGIISVLGERLAEVTQVAVGLPLPKRIGSTRVLMSGSVELPLLSVSPTRIDAIVPMGLTPNTPQQLLVERASTITRPVTLDVAPAQPAVYVESSAAERQGRVSWVRSPTGETALARPGTPAQAGDLLVISATGLGITAPLVADGEPAPESPIAKTG
ncbi:MAG: BACON domain-containing protein, partial [Bryobacteraceae bacterium]